VDSSKLRFEIKVCIAMEKTINVVKKKKNLAFGNTVMKVPKIRIMINVNIYNIMYNLSTKYIIIVDGERKVITLKKKKNHPVYIMMIVPQVCAVCPCFCVWLLFYYLFFNIIPLPL